jgi:hypothetical protein
VASSRSANTGLSGTSTASGYGMKSFAAKLIVPMQWTLEVRLGIAVDIAADDRFARHTCVDG